MAKQPAKVEKTFVWKTNSTHVSVRSVSPNGYWCAQRKFGPISELVAKDELSDTQAQELTIDPFVITVEVDPPTPAPKKDGPSPGA